MHLCSSTSKTSASLFRSRFLENKSIDASIPREAPSSCSFLAAAERKSVPRLVSFTIADNPSSPKISVCLTNHSVASWPSSLTNGINVDISASGSTLREVSNSSAKLEDPSRTRAPNFHQVMVSFCCGLRPKSKPACNSSLDRFAASSGNKAQASVLRTKDSSSSPGSVLELFQSLQFPSLKSNKSENACDSSDSDFDNSSSESVASLPK